MPQGDKIKRPLSLSGTAERPLWVSQMNHFGKENIPFLFILDFKTISPVIIPLEELDNNIIRFSFSHEREESQGKHPHNHFLYSKYPVDFSVYRKGFQSVLKAIQAGDTYLLNLCYSTKLTGDLDLDKIYTMASAPYKLLVRDRFVVFSPESFVSIEDDVIRTFPMKGTVDASIPDAERILLNDPKEKEEHATIVDLLRNDLSMVAKKVGVARYRYVTEVKAGDRKLLQCSSEITGNLEPGYQAYLGDIFRALLPAGSVTGAPKKKTVELIEAIEPEPRSFFTGIFGCYDGRGVQSAVMIRMIEKRNDGFYYRSGGGITYRSDAGAEYQEMIDKVYIPTG